MERENVRRPYRPNNRNNRNRGDNGANNNNRNNFQNRDDDMANNDRNNLGGNAPNNNGNNFQNRGGNAANNNRNNFRNRGDNGANNNRNNFRNRGNNAANNNPNNFQNGGNDPANNNQNKDDDAPRKSDKGPIAKRERKTEATNPIGYKTLEAVLKTENDVELILKLSSRMNGFLLLLDQPSIRPDFMCLILATLAKASQTSTEQSTVQMLVHFFMEIIPKLSSKSNFHRELKLYIAELSNHCAIHSPQKPKHVEAIQNLLIFLRRLQLLIYQKSFDAVSDLMQLITAQIEFINRKGNALSDYIVEVMAQLNDAVENFEQMKNETEKTEVLMEPPNDFRQMGIYPDTYDILSNHDHSFERILSKEDTTQSIII